MSRFCWRVDEWVAAEIKLVASGVRTKTGQGEAEQVGFAHTNGRLFVM